MLGTISQKKTTALCKELRLREWHKSMSLTNVFEHRAKFISQFFLLVIICLLPPLIVRITFNDQMKKMTSWHWLCYLGLMKGTAQQQWESCAFPIKNRVISGSVNLPPSKATNRSYFFLPWFCCIFPAGYLLLYFCESFLEIVLRT